MVIFKFGYLAPYGVKPSQLKEYKEYIKNNSKSLENKKINEDAKKILLKKFTKFVSKYPDYEYDEICNNSDFFKTDEIIEYEEHNLFNMILLQDGILLKDKVIKYLENTNIDMKSKTINIIDIIKDDEYVIRYCASRLSIPNNACSFGKINDIRINLDKDVGEFGFWYKINKKLDEEVFTRIFENEIILLRNKIIPYQVDIISVSYCSSLYMKESLFKLDKVLAIPKELKNIITKYSDEYFGNSSVFHTYNSD
jgi:hypothetical protein